MKQTAIINIVGLSKRLLGEFTPFLSEWSKKKNIRTIDPVLPAVTCSVQSTYLTGSWPKDHGIVGNGWYFRELNEIKLWKQSNKLVQGEKVWDKAKKLNPEFTCANMFWWYNMYSSADYSVTPRPQYLADGRKIPDCYSYPPDLRHKLQKELGTFPLFHFWGPMANIKSSAWISDASKLVHDWTDPTLMLIYLPHLDYILQKNGHNETLIKKDLLEIDQVAKDLILYLENKGVDVTILSEYGITNVSNPIHINRVLRKMGLIHIREERGLELLDAGNSSAFALADHQIAHIYINEQSKFQEIKAKLEEIPGIELVLDKETKKKYHLNHSRSGELVAIADKESWFTYYYWEDDKKAPDFARNVDIHNKPGYDPVEMFLDPNKKLIMPRIVMKVLKKKLGFRTMMDVIPLDATLVKGSHGRVNVADEDKAIFIGNYETRKSVVPTQISEYILSQIFG
jgi:predicted AlkP superfamily pyrophosphatase or phosphodiesterase